MVVCILSWCQVPKSKISPIFRKTQQETVPPGHTEQLEGDRICAAKQGNCRL
jgi:hypothetical protein